MKIITAIIRPERLQHVKEALFKAGISGISLSRISGHGGEQVLVEHYRGNRVMVEFQDKVQISMAVSDPFVDSAIKAIVQGARTGEVGDGKIFVQPSDRVVRIRSGEEDTSALTPVNETIRTPPSASERLRRSSRKPETSKDHPRSYSPRTTHCVPPTSYFPPTFSRSPTDEL